MHDEQSDDVFHYLQDKLQNYDIEDINEINNKKGHSVKVRVTTITKPIIDIINKSIIKYKIKSYTIKPNKNSSTIIIN